MNNIVMSDLNRNDRVKLKRDRKDKIDLVLAQAMKLEDADAAEAWRRLRRELLNMTHPEAPMPRFNALLHACWIAASNDQT